LSNTAACASIKVLERDELHRHSKLSSAVKAVIAGLGPYGYIVAMQAALQALGKLPDSLPAPLRVGPR